MASKLKRHRLMLRDKVLKHLPESLKGPLYRKMIKIDLDPLPGLELRVARTEHELSSAFRLLHDNYVRSGFMNPHPSGMRITKYHALSSTTTLIACIGEKVVGTVSIVRNGAFGVPLDSVFDVNPFLKKGVRIAEVSSLAVHPEHSGKRGQILFPLLNFLYHYCEYYFGVDYLVIAVNPTWWDFYRHVLLFEKLEDRIVAEYSFVNGAPAVGGILNLKTARERYSAMYNHRAANQNLFEYLGNKTISGVEYPTRGYGKVSDPVMTPDLLRHFFVEQSDALSKLSENEKVELWNLYSHRDFRKHLPRPLTPVAQLDGRGKNLRHDIDGEVRVHTNHISLTGRIKNASHCGMLLIANRGLRQGESIELEIPISENEIIRVTANVVWSDVQGASGLRIAENHNRWGDLIRSLENELLHERKPAA